MRKMYLYSEHLQCRSPYGRTALGVHGAYRKCCLLDQGVQAGLVLVIFGHIAIGWHSRADDGLLGLHSREGPEQL